jgi:hypothetical protein
MDEQYFVSATGIYATTTNFPSKVWIPSESQDLDTTSNLWTESTPMSRSHSTLSMQELEVWGWQIYSSSSSRVPCPSSTRYQPSVELWLIRCQRFWVRYQPPYSRDPNWMRRTRGRWIGRCWELSVSAFEINLECILTLL